MARWLSLATLLALCLHFCTADFFVDNQHTKLPPCPKEQVCVLFTDDKCQRILQNGEVKWEETPDLGWMADKTCEKGDYEKFIASISFEPISLKQWKIEVNFRHDEAKQRPGDMIFVFGRASLSFPTEKTALFTWEKNLKTESSTPVIHKNAATSIRQSKGIFRWSKIIGLASEDHEVNLYKYSIEAEANGEKLIDFMSTEVKFILKKDTRTMNDARFLEQLRALSPCDVSEIKDVCHDEPCETLANNGLNRLDPEITCPSKLWMHSVDETMTRNWKKIDKIQCEHGTWKAITITTTYTKAESEEVTQDSENADSKTRRKREESEETESEETDPPKIATNTTDSKAIDHSYEFQCTSVEPAKMTTTMKMILGFGISGAVVLIIAVVAGIVVCMLRRKKARENDFGTTKSHGGTTSKSKAGTPSGKAAH